MKLKPEILCQPNVPTPLHGMAPRVVFGESWWNMKYRQDAIIRIIEKERKDGDIEGIR